MNQVVKLPQLNKVMMTMSREMEKAGLIEVCCKVVFKCKNHFSSYASDDD